MKNKNSIIIGITAIAVGSLLYLSYRKATQKDITNDVSLKKDYDTIMKKIQDAKK